MDHKIFKKLHPVTQSIMIQIDEWVNREFDYSKENIAQTREEIKDLEYMFVASTDNLQKKWLEEYWGVASRRTRMIKRKLPATTQNIENSEIEHAERFLRENLPLQILNGLTMEEATERLTKHVEKCVAHRGSPEVLAWLKKIHRLFDQAEKSAFKDQTLIREHFHIDQLDERVRAAHVLAKIFPLLKEQEAKLLHSTCIDISHDLPHAPERERAAAACFITAKHELRKGYTHLGEWRGRSKCMQAVVYNYEWGLAFLDGDSKWVGRLFRKVTPAISDGITKKVWNTVHLCFEQSYLSANKSRHTKHLLLQHVSDAPRIQATRKI